MTWISQGGRGSPVIRSARGYGCFGDGASHPLSTVFPGITLGQAQAMFPAFGVTGTGQEYDGCAIAQLFSDNSNATIEPGTYLTSASLVCSCQQVNAYGATIKAGTSGITFLMQMRGFGLTVKGLTLEGGVYNVNSPLLQPNGTLGLNGATHGFRIQSCANSRFADCSARGFQAYGWAIDSNGVDIADFCLFDNIFGNNCGILDIWQLTLSGGASGTFTITVKDRFNNSQTTTNITIGTTQIGAGQAYNVAGLPNPGGSAPGGFLEGLIGNALHHPGNAQGTKTYGFGSKNAQSVCLDSTSPSALNPTGRGTVISAGGTYYLIWQGDHLGPGPQAGGTWVVSNTAPSGGGTATMTHLQTGVKGGGLGTLNTTDANFYTFHNPKMRSNFGDGMYCAPTNTWLVEQMDGEFNYGTSHRLEGAGGTAGTTNMIVRGDHEGCWAPVMLEVNAGAGGGGTIKGTWYGDPQRDSNDICLGQAGLNTHWFQDGNAVSLPAG